MQAAFSCLTLSPFSGLLGFLIRLSSFATFSFSIVPLQTPEELDDSDFETEDFDIRSRTSVQTEDDQLIAGQSARVSCTLHVIVFAHIPESHLLPLKIFTCQMTVILPCDKCENVKG